MAAEDFSDLVRAVLNGEDIKSSQVAERLAQVTGKKLPPGMSALSGFTPAEMAKLDPRIPLRMLDEIDKLHDIYPMTVGGLVGIQPTERPVPDEFGITPLRNLAHHRAMASPDEWMLGVNPTSLAQMEKGILTNELSGLTVPARIQRDPLAALATHETGHAWDRRLSNFIRDQSGRTGSQLQRQLQDFKGSLVSEAIRDPYLISGYAADAPKKAIMRLSQRALGPGLERQMGLELGSIGFDPMRARHLHPEVLRKIAVEPTAELFALRHAGSTQRPLAKEFMQRMDDLDTAARGAGFRGASTLGTMAGVAAPALVALIANKNKEAGKVAAGAATGAGLGSIFGGRGALVGAGLGALGSQLF